MKKHTNYEKQMGELAMRFLSDEAFKYYGGTDPLNVYEVEDESGEKKYDVDECGVETLGLTFDEVDELFRDLYKESTTITLTDVANALINYDSMEQDGNTARYFLHITDLGEVLPTLAGADETFTADVDVSDLDGDWRDEFENLNNEEFRDVCENLWRQANEYLDTWKEEN